MIILLFSFLLLNVLRLPAEELVYQSENLEIAQLNEDTYLHISYLDTENWGKVNCNGVAIANGSEAVVIDSPVDSVSSQELIDFLHEKGYTILAIIPTHFHNDCVGGLAVFVENDIDIIMSEQTFEILKSDVDYAELEATTFEKEYELSVGDEKVIFNYFGAGHTKDNIVGYYAKEQMLFGGCLIKALGSSKGNLEDADEEQWSATVKKIKKEYPDIKTVIPGHGNKGDIKLLDYTIQLFEK